MAPNPHLTQAPDQLTEMSASGAAATATAPVPGAQEVTTRLLAALDSTGDGTFADLISAECVDHDPLPGGLRGPAGYAQTLHDLRKAFPDLRVEVDHLVIAGDEVAAVLNISGTHTGEDFLGARARGDGFSIRGAQVCRIAEGLVVERWGAFDSLTALQQLGIREVPS
jgi:predicted ester cyclase